MMYSTFLQTFPSSSFSVSPCLRGLTSSCFLLPLSFLLCIWGQIPQAPLWRYESRATPCLRGLTFPFLSLERNHA